MGNTARALERLGWPVRRMEPKPTEEQMAKWLRKLRAGDNGLEVVDKLVKGHEIVSAQIIDTRYVGGGDSLTFIRADRKNGKVVVTHVTPSKDIDRMTKEGLLDLARNVLPSDWMDLDDYKRW